MVDSAHHSRPGRAAAHELDAHRRRYEARYHGRNEPWDYSTSGAEQLRYERVIEIAREWKPRCRRALDIGCSLGQFTDHIAGYATEVLAVDIARGAVSRARSRREQRRGGGADHVPATISFLVCSASDLCFRSRAVDVIFYCDGLREHGLGAALQQRVANDIERLLTDDGIAIFTDYLHPRDFDDYIATIRRLGFRIRDVRYLHDRPWFQFKSWFRALPQRGLVRRLLASRRIARALGWIGRLRGRGGSRHLCIVARTAGTESKTTGPRSGTGR